MLTFHTSRQAPLTMFNGAGSLRGLLGLGAAPACTTTVCTGTSAAQTATFKALQAALNELMAMRMTVFGAKNAIGQQQHSLTVDGKIGANTRDAIRAIAAGLPGQPRGSQWAKMAKFALDGDDATISSIANAAQAWLDATTNAIAYFGQTTATGSGPAPVPNPQIPLDQLLAQLDPSNQAGNIINANSGTTQPGAGTQVTIRPTALPALQLGTSSIPGSYIVGGLLALGALWYLKKRRDAAPLAGSRGARRKRR